MTKAEQQKMKARERARRHYEKKKAERENQALESDVDTAPIFDSRRLALVQRSEVDESQTDTLEPSPLEKNIAETEAREEQTQSETVPKEPNEPSKWRWVGRILRGLIIAALTVLMAILQADFYRQHDIAPNLAWPFAIAVELGFLSLVTLKFDGAFDWLRRIILLVVFIYFGATLIFQIGYKARENIIDQKSVEIIDLQNQLKIAQDNLDVATKGKSWDNMRLFGGEVVRLQTAIRDLPRAEALGVTQSEVALFEASLLVVMRVLLLAISGLNTVKLRNEASR